MTRSPKATDTPASKSGFPIALAVGAFLLGAVGILMWRILTAPVGGEVSAVIEQPPAGDLVARPPTASPARMPIVLGIAHTNDTWGYLYPCG
ncbi:MAG: hypothetical protein ACUVWB_05225 [Anaerolineae bacterium]